MASTLSLPLPTTPAWIRNSLIGGFVFFICWAVAIAYWRSTRSAPATTELAVCLFAIPLALIGTLWLGARLVLARVAAPAPIQAAVKPAVPAPAAPVLASLAILASALRSPHGASAEELAAAIASGKARADLDPELIDDDGFPVMAARSHDAGDEALRTEIAEWLSHNGMAELQFSDAQWRALAMASGVAGDLALDAAALAGAENRVPMLQLLPILPFDWHIDQRHAVSLWLKHVVERSGWPPACIAMPAAPLADADKATSSAVFRRLALDAAEKSTPLAALVIACASHIGQETVDRWAASGKLFTSSRPQGSIPGEGAVGLLVTDMQQARSTGHREVVMLEPMQEARHAASVDDAKRADPGILEELTKRVMQGHHADFMGVAMIVADTGHRSSRMLELMGYASVTMPQLDDTGDIVCLGVACGSCDAVPFITALALARHYALERFGSILCVSNEDARLRHAALVQPAAPAAV